MQIADARAARRASYRDLKPANVKVTLTAGQSARLRSQPGGRTDATSASGEFSDAEHVASQAGSFSARRRKCHRSRRRPSGGSSQRHLLVRLRCSRDADGPAAVQGDTAPESWPRCWCAADIAVFRTMSSTRRGSDSTVSGKHRNAAGRRRRHARRARRTIAASPRASDRCGRSGSHAFAVAARVPAVAGMIVVGRWPPQYGRLKPVPAPVITRFSFALPAGSGSRRKPPVLAISPP